MNPADISKAMDQVCLTPVEGIIGSFIDDHGKLVRFFQCNCSDLAILERAATEYPDPALEELEMEELDRTLETGLYLEAVEEGYEGTLEQWQDWYHACLAECEEEDDGDGG